MNRHRGERETAGGETKSHASGNGYPRLSAAFATGTGDNGVCQILVLQGKAKTVTIYQDHETPPHNGISTGSYTKVDGYRWVNVYVEFEQMSADEEPVSVGVIFAHDKRGRHGSRRYFSFEENFDAPADLQMITLSGRGPWHGSPHNRSSYIARLPIMGPYMQVFPFNHHDDARRFSIVLYLTE